MSGFPPCVPCGGRETNHDRSVHCKGASHLSAGKSSWGGVSQRIEPPQNSRRGRVTGPGLPGAARRLQVAERASVPRLGTGITKKGSVCPLSV